MDLQGLSKDLPAASQQIGPLVQAAAQKNEDQPHARLARRLRGSQGSQGSQVLAVHPTNCDHFCTFTGETP